MAGLEKLGRLILAHKKMRYAGNLLSAEMLVNAEKNLSTFIKNAKPQILK